MFPFTGGGSADNTGGSPPVSIIIVNYNTRAHLIACLKSLSPLTSLISPEIFVVDNASSDGSADAVENEFPGVILIKLNENIGYAAANNKAITIAGGDFILLLNPDTIVEAGTIPEMLRFMKKHERTGIASCRVDLPDGSLDAACRRTIPTPAGAFYQAIALHKLFPRSKRFARYNLSWRDPAGSYQVEAICGAFFLVRREVIDQVGLLDERFFMYAEDLDYCLRCIRKGWQIRYHGAVRILHYKRAASASAPGRMLDVFHETMALFYKKHYAARHGIIYNSAILSGIRARYILSKVLAVFQRN